MPSLLLIDGSGYIFRAYHALPPLTSPNGTPVGAVLGFVNMLTKLLVSHKADHVLVVFDAARVSFRNRIYPEYKAHRPPAPEDLVPQFALVRAATDALNLPRVELEDFEADDLIASYAQAAQAQGYEVTILSSDKDLMQLIGDGVSMYDPMKNKPIGEAEVMEKFGVAPAKICEVQALIGDSSDNVPGVPGIGPKTAAELINQFGDVEALLSRLSEIKQPKRRDTLMQNAENARISRELVELKRDVPLPIALEELTFRTPAPEKLLAFAVEHGFKSLIAKLQGTGTGDSGLGKKEATTPTATPNPQSPISKAQYELIRDLPALQRWIAAAHAAGIVSFDTETTGLDAMQAELVGVSLASVAGKACYIPLAHIVAGGGEPKGDLFSAPATKQLIPDQIPMDAALAALKPLLADASVLKIGQNLKYDMQIMARYGCEITPIDDTMLLSYVLSAGANGHGMDELAECHLQHKTISYDEVTGTGRARISFAEVALDKARDYAAEDADITLRLWECLKPKVAAQGLLTVYETIERPLVAVLRTMEAAGIKVDAQVLSSLSNEFALKMHALEEDIHKLAGQPFNIGSPKQLGEILFEKLQLPGGKKSAKTGAWGTDSDVLEELAEHHPMPLKVLEWRQLAKLKGTYTDALAGQINPRTERVHTSYAMATASTGRLSSTDPNLQNIPIRTQEGRRIRTAFVAEPGHKLISADYSQIELRLLAHVAEIGTLKDAFRNGDDIHAITASQMFGVPVSEVNADLRRSAKTINFGIIYGISAHGLATRLGIGRSEAGAYIERYFTQYPGIRDYMETQKEFARAHGYVVTLFGRRCHVPYINEKNPNYRQFAERQAINAPLQGTAADIIKRAMIAISRMDIPAKMLLQVHDELVFEAPAESAQAALALIKPIMEKTSQFSVPLTVEAGIGDNWGEIH